ncbi:class I SAM-dependent methyltransferase [Dysgonomonas termitidis]
MAAIYFANKYRTARVFAIEPEKENYVQMLKNTATYSNITCLRKGLWHKSCCLEIKNKNADSYGFQVIESCEPTDITAISIYDLIKKYDLHQIDI